jgi:hypothetical protein
VAGRVWTPRARREALLDEFERGGTPAAEFARLVGIKYPTFASWVQQRRRARAAGGVGPAVAPVRWMEALLGAGAPAALCVQLPSGARMEIGDAGAVPLAAQLLRALADGEARRPVAQELNQEGASC